MNIEPTIIQINIIQFNGRLSIQTKAKDLSSNQNYMKSHFRTDSITGINVGLAPLSAFIPTSEDLICEK
jgi:hypothetical protein